MVMPGHTFDMKTAISIPDEIFERASRRAHELGMSRSEFFSRAAIRYLNELDAVSVTHQIDQTVDAQAQLDESALDAVAVGGHVVDDGSGGDW
jgi:metal-responsive CopG/Arc/MetJ family transcriptional regulator